MYNIINDTGFIFRISISTTFPPAICVTLDAKFRREEKWNFVIRWKPCRLGESHTHHAVDIFFGRWVFCIFKFGKCAIPTKKRGALNNSAYFFCWGGGGGLKKIDQVEIIHSCLVFCWGENQLASLKQFENKRNGHLVDMFTVDLPPMTYHDLPCSAKIYYNTHDLRCMIYCKLGCF